MRQTNKNKGEEFLIPEYQLSDLGVFGFIANDHPTLHISGGLRFDHTSLTSDELLLTTEEIPTTNPAEADQTKFTAFDRNFSNISGSAGATFDFTRFRSVNLNMSYRDRAPNIAELASNGRHEATLRFEHASPDLQGETRF